MTSNDVRALGVRSLDVKFVLMLQRIQNHFGLVSQSQLGSHMGYSTKTAERSLRKLKDLGWLVMHRTGSKTWEYEVTEKCPFILSKEATLKDVPYVDHERIYGRCKASVSDLTYGYKKTKNVCSQDEVKCEPKNEQPRLKIVPKEPPELKIVPENPPEEEEILEDEDSDSSSEPSKTESDPSSHIKYYRIISTVLDTKNYTYTCSYYDQEVDTYYSSTDDYSKKNKLNNYICAVRTQSEKSVKKQSLKPVQQSSCKEQDMAEPKITGSDSGSLAELKRRLESGESYFVGKRKKTNSFKDFNASAVEFNKEEPFSQEKEEKHSSPRKSPREKSEEKEKSKYNQYDMWFVFTKCWREYGYKGNPIPWTVKDRKQVKELIEEQGPEAIITYIEYCFKYWSHLAFTCRINNIAPSIQTLYGYRHTLLIAALNPDRSVKRQGAEYTGLYDTPTGSWGSDDREKRERERMDKFANEF